MYRRYGTTILLLSEGKYSGCKGENSDRRIIQDSKTSINKVIGNWNPRKQVMMSVVTIMRGMMEKDIRMDWRERIFHYRHS